MNVTGKLSMYLSLVRLEFLKMLAYRISFLTGVVNYTVQIGAYYFIWQAIYSGKKVIGGLSQEEMITYVVIAWVGRSFYFNNLDRAITQEIKSGQVAMELIRPYSYFGTKIARAFGEAAFRLLFFTIPSFVFLSLFIDFKVSADAQTFMFFGLALFGSFLLNAQVNYITGLIAFFTVSTAGVQRAKRVVVDLLSGLLLPILLYPEAIQRVIGILPFQAISYLPNLIYLEKIQGTEVWRVFELQIFWFLSLLLLGQVMWYYACKKLAVQGG